jgi:hypothetical protein
MMKSDIVAKNFKLHFILTDTTGDLRRHDHIKLPWNLKSDIVTEYLVKYEFLPSELSFV